MNNATIEHTNTSSTTIVTGIWDLRRDTLSEGWGRPFEHYLTKLSELLKTDDNMIIFIEAKHREFVERQRNSKNTLIVVRELDWFKANGYIFDNIQKIRNNPAWYNQVGWLTESTQAKLEMYNPVVMSKVFLLNDAAIMDPFNSTHLIWVDGGLTSTVHSGYFWKDKVVNNIKEYFTKFSFVCFPYNTTQEIHGFEYNSMCGFAGADINKVARGGLFGGPKETIKKTNELYYSLLLETLSKGLMGTEESIFTIMLYKYPELFQYFEIEGNGLMSPFFENLKNKTLTAKSELMNMTGNNLDTEKVSLYVLTFNSPNQFKTLLESFNAYDSNYYRKPIKKILLDNSTNTETYEEYKALCDKYNFEHIKKDNLGICGGRQFIAEHFAESDSDYMLFFEDDMFFCPETTPCKSGFTRYVRNLYTNSLQIIQKENLDFLKLNFSEFYGDNSTQWAWYNVPQQIREKYWPNKTKLPVQGLDPNAPKTKFSSIRVYEGIPYALGEVYYCNWPQIVSKPGNQKMFIDTKWAHPYEQTWMSHIYQQVVENKITSGLLLITPTEHNRFEHYKAGERKES